MSKAEKGIFFLVLLVLLAALAVMLTQSATGSGAGRIYRISVLTDGGDEDYWRSFRKGVEQAAWESNVDVRYVSRFDGGGQGQAEALRQEWSGETEGVVLLPVDGAAVSQVLSEAPQRLAVTVVGARVDSEHPLSRVSADNRAAGARLADAVAESGAADCAVCLPTDPGTAVQERYEGFAARLTELGIPCTLWTEREPLPGRSALAALDPATGEALCARKGAEGRVFAVGSSGRLLRHLQDGVAAALVAQSDYAAGYLSLMRTVGVLKGETVADVSLDTYTVTKDNLFTEPLVRLLFPIG